MNAIIPTPRCEIAIRVATLADLPFLDALQKNYSRALGYFPTKQFEEYIESGGVLVAEVTGHSSLVTRRAPADRKRAASDERQMTNDTSPVTCEAPANRDGAASDKGQVTNDILGYLISRDRYLKRDELGVIYQLCVAPGAQRKLVGASLVQAAFERSAYGCRLYCCWCAQDLEANHFWESLGFVPIAFRAGSAGKKRVHIFWQKRIVEGDGETKWWYPFQTNNGAIRQDRLVFPIPPGVHWKEVQALEVPEAKDEGGRMKDEGAKALPAPGAASRNRPAAVKSGPGPGKVGILVGGRIKYVNVPGYVAPEKPAGARNDEGTRGESTRSVPRKARPKAAEAKIDPKYIKAARELRDRWLERINITPAALLPSGRYEVSRRLLAVAEPPRLPTAKRLKRERAATLESQQG